MELAPVIHFCMINTRWPVKAISLFKAYKTRILRLVVTTFSGDFWAYLTPSGDFFSNLISARTITYCQARLVRKEIIGKTLIMENRKIV